jgi:hypothetical protein
LNVVDKTASVELDGFHDAKIERPHDARHRPFDRARRTLATRYEGCAMESVGALKAR